LPSLAIGCFWPFSSFDEGQLLLMLKDRTGPVAADQLAATNVRFAFDGCRPMARRPHVRIAKSATFLSA